MSKAPELQGPATGAARTGRRCCNLPSLEPCHQGAGTRVARRHEQFDAIPEASLEALRTQLAAAKEEKDKLVRQHQEELDAQKTSYQKLKEQLIQLGLDHAKALETAESAAEARLNEALEDAGNANVVLQAELEEAAKARKVAEDKAAQLDAEQKEYDLLTYAIKKVGERRVLQAHKNLGLFGLGNKCQTPSPLSATASRVPAEESGSGSALLPVPEQTQRFAPLRYPRAVPGRSPLREGAEIIRGL
ncbi:hypothetical protein QYE76_021909 [Lolium multiflorum]|uniref:Uncharacterized protein n=1 Tax=Lolium multiflorum TaxID=4521 RepID=A0AAD8R9Y3_LOLMU|nr:hypothetical protein QYE76_021909 [Lolium multiflorum]